MKVFLIIAKDILLFFVLVSGIVSCQPSSEGKEYTVTTDKAQEVVDSAIAVHGGELFNHMALSFDFRDRHYTALRENGNFVYIREFTDSLGQVKDVLSNSGFYREVNGAKVKLTDERTNAYSNSVNSVIYFALLPFGLNDASVNKEYLGITSIKGESYHKIKVTFDQEGGGSDHEDEYVYWINTNSHRVDYLAYSFQVNEGGMRFREAKNVRNVDGILFADYINYKPVADTATLEKLDTAFENGELEKLSEINLENITLTTDSF